MLGVAIHIVGSVGINLGQNIQALALSRRPDLKNYPCGSTLWRWGMALFITASIVTFGALALASASILVPLESVQFIVNIAFNKFIRHKTITLRMYLGVLLVIAGIVLFVLFGPNEGACFEPQQLECFWKAPVWWVYVSISFGIAALSYVTWRLYDCGSREGKPYAYTRVVEPTAYTLQAALFGGCLLYTSPSPRDS